MFKIQTPSDKLIAKQAYYVKASNQAARRILLDKINKSCDILSDDFNKYAIKMKTISHKIKKG